MTKQKLEIQDFEDKKSKDGKRYTRFKTSDGWMSCFEGDVTEELKKCEGQFKIVEVAESGNFKNIRQVYPNGEPVESVVIAGEEPKPKKNGVFEKDPVGLAVDVFVALKPEGEESVDLVMRKATELVQQAQRAFE